MMATSLDMNDEPGVIGPDSQLADSLVAELQKLNLTFNEAKILLFLMTHKNACASDVSKHTRIQRTDTYGYISSLLSKGIIFSTFDRPQKYYALSMQEVIDCMVQTKQSELNLLSTKKKEYQEMVDRMANTPSSFPGMKDSYQVIMGENSLNAKIKRMLAEAKEEVTILLSERNLINVYHAGIIDSLIELSKKETHVKLLTTCKNAVYYITNDNGEVCTSVSLKTLLGDIPVNFVLVDNKQIVLLLESPGAKKQESCGFYTNNASLVSAFDFVFSTGNSFGLPK